MTFSLLTMALAVNFLTPAATPLPIISALRAQQQLSARQPVSTITIPPYLCDDQEACKLNRLLAAHILEQRGEWLNAADFYQELAEEIPIIADYLLLHQITCDMAGGAYERAQTAAARLADEYPDSRFYKNNQDLAPSIAMALQDYSKAEQLYGKLLDDGVKIRLATLHLGLATSRLMLGNKLEAAKEFQYVATHWPAAAAGKEAKEHLGILQKENILPPELTYREQKAYAKALRKGGKNSQSAALYESLLKKQKANSKEYLELAPLLLDALLGADRYGEAAAWMKKLPLDKFTDQTQRYELEIRLAKGQHNKIRQQQIFEKMVQRLPQKKAARTAILKRACDAHDDGDFALALKHFQGLYENGLNDNIAQDAIWRTFLIHFEEGRHAEAMTMLDRLGQIYQRDKRGLARIEYWRARTFEEQHQTAAAQEAYQNCQEILPLGYYAMLAGMHLGQASNSSVNARLLTATADGGNWLLTDDTPLCGQGPRELKIPAATLINTGEQPENIQRASLFSILGLTQEVFNELATLGAKGQQAENLELTTALDDFYHSYSWGRKALGSAAEQAPTAESSDRFRAWFPLAYSSFIGPAAQANNLDQFLLWGLMRQESAYKPFAHSWANARGLMQIIPKTGQKIAAAKNDDGYSDDRLYEEPLAINYSAWYLAALLQKYHWQLPLAIGSYNAGPKAMSRWIDSRGQLDMDLFVERIPYRETRNYIKYVLGGLHGYCAVYAPGSFIPWPEKPDREYGDNINF